MIQIAFGLFEPLRGIVATLIAMDGMYADFAGAKICPRPDCAAGTISEPGRFDPRKPPSRRLNKKGPSTL